MLKINFQVYVEVEAMDKGGNFIGWCFVDNVNLSIALIEEGLAKVHFTAERSVHYNTLVQAEARAKAKKLNVSKFYSVTNPVNNFIVFFFLNFCQRLNCLYDLKALESLWGAKGGGERGGCAGEEGQLSDHCRHWGLSRSSLLCPECWDR